MTTYTIPLSFTKPPITLNTTFRHWAQKAKVVKEVRREGMIRAKAAKIGRHERIHVQLHYQPKDRRKRDSDNLVPTQKHLVDGLVDAGVVPDDNTDHVSWTRPEIHQPVRGEPGRMWLEVHVLGVAHTAHVL